MAILNNSNAISTAGGYDINNSVRLRRSASGYLQRTSSHSTQTYTYSFWMKKSPSNVSAEYIFGYYNGAGSSAGFRVTSDQLEWYSYALGMNAQVLTTQVFRDPSAWYHIVGVMDTTNATSTERIRLYINGVRVTAGTFTYPSQNFNTYMGNNLGWAWGISGGSTSGSTYFDGYLAEINVIDGQALTASSFGETDTTTGAWKPKAYTGTYGTGGYYLKFSDIATTSGSNAGLGKDFSGNTNYWTTNNISVTSGTTYDAMKDSPTLTSATVANYCVMNPLNKDTSITVTDGNLAASAAGTNIGVTGSIAISSGKWYWEITQTAGGVATSNIVGITDATLAAKTAGLTTNSYGYGTGTTAYKWNAGTNTAYGSNWTNGDVISVAFDADAGTITFYKNNVSQGTAFTGISGTFYPAFGFQNGSAYAVNFGQRPLAYTPPTGYVALNTYNLPTPTILQGNKYMDATLYTGTGSALTVTNAGAFKPDFVWIKSRSNAYEHGLFDSVRGALKVLRSASTAAEVTETAGTSLTGFNSNGFALGTNGGTVSTNVNGATFVGWQWQAGQGSTSSNTSGSITSTVSVNTTAGFSVVTYTGNGSTTGATVGHGLGVAPKLIIVKDRGAVDSWLVQHASTGATGYLNLNGTGAFTTSARPWNNTAPTISVFTVNTFAGEIWTNKSADNYVAYCWAEIAGYSKFGSYTGNGSTDGPFIATNFAPKFVLVKRTDSSTNGFWNVYDSARNGYNDDNDVLYPNSSSAEDSVQHIDLLSNGFKCRNATYPNTSGATYIYACFASNPFKNSNAR